LMYLSGVVSGVLMAGIAVIRLINPMGVLAVLEEDARQ